MITTSFRETGLTLAGFVGNVSTAGQLAAQVPAGKQLVVFDVISSGVTTLDDASGGPAIIQIPAAGGYHFSAGVPFGDNKAVFSSGSAVKVTITYTIIDSTM